MDLLKNKPHVYKVQTSEREVYETERYYLLKVVDCSGNLEKELPKIGWYEGVEELLNVLFEAHFFSSPRVFATLTMFMWIGHFCRQRPQPTQP